MTPPVGEFDTKKNTDVLRLSRSGSKASGLKRNAELVKAQDHVTILEEGTKRAKDEAFLWKTEALKLKDELTRREAPDDEQQATDDKSIMNAIKNSNANKKVGFAASVIPANGRFDVATTFGLRVIIVMDIGNSVS
ncbi:hypothetical protein N0V86_004157 [Didymella sp. IMI 355093]|nr:hypothetical protein N0V86_004157 [Didymella sp. IMI 355093]